MPSLKNQVIFDLLNLHYIRTVIVDKKSGLRNLRGKNEDNEGEELISINTLTKKRKTKKKTNKSILEEISSDEDAIKILLTKEKILELQSKDSNGLRSFINILPFYGEEISLIKHRPNKEKYPAGKAQEPLIKIDVSNFTRRIDVKLRENPEFYKKFKNMQTEIKHNYREENNIISTNFISSNTNNNEITNKSNEEINKEFMGNASTSLMNIFNVKSTKIIKYIDFLIYFFIIASITIEFILSAIQMADNKNRFKYLSDSYKILTHISFIKYFITEAVISNTSKSYIDLDSNRVEYISYIKSELAYYREEFTEIFQMFTSKSLTFSKEYSSFLSQHAINVTTLSNGLKTIEEQPFISALNKLITSIFYISTMPDSEPINMENKYSFELMFNLLNQYYSYFEKIVFLIVNDYLDRVKNYGITNIIIFCITISISIFYIFIFWRLMSKLDNDREKPINLFLTIKKRVFEDLKNSSESFSNKLLNKFFGNEENEEESQQEYISNVKSNDINIAKFKALNEYKALINKKSSFIFYFIQIILLFIVFNLFMLVKYINANEYHKNVYDFTHIYNKTRLSYIYLVSRLDVIKQYLFNDTIPNFNYPSKRIYNFAFIVMSLELGQSLHSSSYISSRLINRYKNIFTKYIYNDYKEIIQDNLETNLFNNLLTNISSEHSIYYNKTENGLLQNLLDIYEILRFFVVQSFINDTRDENNISYLIYDSKWFDLNDILISLVRPWYSKMLDIFDSYLYESIELKKIYYMSIFVILIIITSIYYWIFWKNYEENFITLIKKSFDLINLIPEEIKSIIVLKLNE